MLSSRWNDEHSSPMSGHTEVNPDTPNPRGATHWESVHVCPKCSHILNLAEIDLKTITTGIVECPRCDWIGPVEIQVAEADESAG